MLLFYYLFVIINIIIIFNHFLTLFNWGLGIGDWGLGIGDWGLGPIPNPQSPNIKIYILKII